jgi:hypothetical protein
MKSVIDNLEQVDEALRGEYEAKAGKFYLKLEDIPSGFVKQEDLLAANTKVVEFRDKNIALMKENAELVPLKTKFEGIDPVEARAALDKLKTLGKEGIRDADDLAQKIKNEAEALIKPLRDQLALSTAETQAERRRADESLLHSKIAEQFIKVGGKPNATDFVVGLAKDNFEVKDGKVVAKAGKFSTTKPGDPISVEEWLASDVSKNHDYVLEASKGGGTPPKPASGPVPSKLRADQKVLKNPTPQELGAYASDIAAGKLKVEYETVTQ